MTVFRFRVTDENPAHVRADLYCGPDPDHLALSGRLTFRAEEWPAFADAITQWNERQDGGEVAAGFEVRVEWGIQHYDGPINPVAARPDRIHSPHIHLWRRRVRTWPNSAVWIGPWTRANQETEVAR